MAATPNASYVARLLQRGPDAFLKKIGEEATEVVMASKDLDVALAGGAGVDDRRAKLVGEVADLWFHCMVALAHYGLRPSDVTDELAAARGHQRHRGKGLAQGHCARGRLSALRHQERIPA